MQYQDISFPMIEYIFFCFIYKMYYNVVLSEFYDKHHYGTHVRKIAFKYISFPNSCKKLFSSYSVLFLLILTPNTTFFFLNWVAIKELVPLTLKRLRGIDYNKIPQVNQPGVFWHTVVHSTWMESKLEGKRHIWSGREVSDTFEISTDPIFFSSSQ